MSAKLDVYKDPSPWGEYRDLPWRVVYLEEEWHLRGAPLYYARDHAAALEFALDYIRRARAQTPGGDVLKVFSRSVNVPHGTRLTRTLRPRAERTPVQEERGRP